VGVAAAARERDRFVERPFPSAISHWQPVAVSSPAAWRPSIIFPWQGDCAAGSRAHGRRPEGSGLTSEACEFVRSKSLLNHADSRFCGCGFAVDLLWIALVELRARLSAGRVLLLGARK
jgi:hypothetical protein